MVRRDEHGALQVWLPSEAAGVLEMCLCDPDKHFILSTNGTRALAVVDKDIVVLVSVLKCGGSSRSGLS